MSRKQNAFKRCVERKLITPKESDVSVWQRSGSTSLGQTLWSPLKALPLDFGILPELLLGRPGFLLALVPQKVVSLPHGFK